jgi:hypothetical protein
MTEVFPQGQSNITTNGNIKNPPPARRVDNRLTFTPYKKNDSAGVLDSLIYINANGDKSRITYNYNQDLSLNYFTNADWFNGKWSIYERHTNSYNSDKKLESVLWELFNTKTEKWHQSAKDVYSYDSLKNRIFRLHQNFNGQEFVNEFKEEDCYDAASNLVLTVSMEWADSAWVNNYKTIYIVNSDNLTDTALIQSWSNNQWVNYQKNIFKYDKKNNIAVNRSKRWIDNKWTDFALGSFTYDENNNCILEDWIISNGSDWEYSFRVFYEYDDDDNLIHLFGKEWEYGQWIPEDEILKVTNPDGILYGYRVKEIFLYYSKPTSVESEKNISYGFNLLQNYPNPFNPNTVISYSIPEPALVTINIYNPLGEKIKTLVNKEQSAGKYQINFNGSNLPSGMYFYQIKTDKFEQTKKMLLLR